MNKILFLLDSLLVGGFMALPACRAADQQTRQYPSQLLEFSSAKEQQVRGIAKELKITIPSEINRFFTAATHGDYPLLSNTLAQLVPESFRLRCTMARQVRLRCTSVFTQLRRDKSARQVRLRCRQPEKRTAYRRNNG